MQLRSGTILAPKIRPNRAIARMHFCGHMCEMWYIDKCCKCADLRPKNAETWAFSRANIKDAVKCKRSRGYCPSCK